MLQTLEFQMTLMPIWILSQVPVCPTVYVPVPPLEWPLPGIQDKPSGKMCECIESLLILKLIKETFENLKQLKSFLESRIFWGFKQKLWTLFQSKWQPLNRYTVLPKIERPVHPCLKQLCKKMNNKCYLS